MTKTEEVSNEGRVFKTVDDFEKRFFPKSYERRKLEEDINETNVYGTGLAIDLLSEIRQEMARA